MKKIDEGAKLEIEEGYQACITLGGYQCAKVICPNITPVQECRPGFFEAIQEELVRICKSEFYLACGKFGDIVGPICPFDPVRLADKYRMISKIEELSAKVEEIAAKI